MKQAQWLNRTLFLCPIRYALCTNEQQFHRELNRLKVTDKPPFTNPNADATTHYLENGKDICAIVCLKLAKRPLVEIVGLLTHEAVHIWREVKQHIGEREPSSEFEAYSIQWITQQLFDAYQTQRKR